MIRRCRASKFSKEHKCMIRCELNAGHTGDHVSDKYLKSPYAWTDDSVNGMCNHSLSLSDPSPTFVGESASVDIDCSKPKGHEGPHQHTLDGIEDSRDHSTFILGDNNLYSRVATKNITITWETGAEQPWIDPNDHC